MAAPTLSAPGVIDITATSARPQVTVTYGATSSGGTISEYNDGVDDWIAHIFESSGTLTVSGGSLDFEYLVVAGGAGGGSRANGTGGGGIVIVRRKVT